MKLIGFPNETAQAYVTAGTSGATDLEPPEMVAAYLKSEEPTDIARLTNLDPRHSQWWFDTGGLEISIAGFALVNHNFEAGSQVRFLARTGAAALHQPVDHHPNAMTASSNVTGSVGNVNEDVSAPDGLVITPTTKTSLWFANFTFPALSPGGPLDQSYAKMAIVCRMRRQFVGAGADNPLSYPTTYCQIIESGVLTFTMGHRAVVATDAGGQILIFPFTATDLSDPTGASITCGITGVPGQSLSGSSYCELETVALYCETAPGAFDSDWITVPGDPRPAPNQPTKSIHWLPDAPLNGVLSYNVLVRSDQSRIDPPTSSATAAVPLGAAPVPHSFVQAGVAPAGTVLSLSRGIRRGSGPSARPSVQELGGYTASGQSYASDAYKFRETDQIEILASREEVQLIYDQLAWRRGRSGAFYVVLEDGVPLDLQLFTAFWSTLKDISPPTPVGRYRADGSMLWSLQVSFREKL